MILWINHGDLSKIGDITKIFLFGYMWNGITLKLVVRLYGKSVFCFYKLVQKYVEYMLSEFVKVYFLSKVLRRVRAE